MTLFAQISSWWKALFDHSCIAVDIEAELQFHNPLTADRIRQLSWLSGTGEIGALESAGEVQKRNERISAQPPKISGKRCSEAAVERMFAAANAYADSPGRGVRTGVPIPLG